MAESCACEGLKLYKEMVRVTYDSVFDPYNKILKNKADDIAHKLYDHLYFHVNKPENHAMKIKMQHELEEMRNTLSGGGKDGYSPLETVRDFIHKVPVCQQALVCGGPYKNDDDRLEEAKIIGKVAEWMGSSDDDMDNVIPELEKLQKKLGCHVGLNPNKYKD
jgi:hypothetical protein